MTSYSQPNTRYTNTGTISDRVTIDATGIVLTNADSGRMIGGVTFSVGGSTIVNQQGGIIRGAFVPRFGTGTAIIGSTGDDTVWNAGSVSGDVSLGAGDDVFTQVSEPVSGVVTLGEGDDVLVVQGGQVLAATDGGIGNDRVRLQTTNVTANNLVGFEDLQIDGGGFFSGFSGFSTISYAAGATLELNASRNPSATISVRGGSFQLGVDSSLAAITGSTGSDLVRIARGAQVTGDISLLGGSDLFGTAVVTLSRQAGAFPVGGVVSGGDGFDTLSLGTADATPDMIEHYDLDLAKVREFETLTFGDATVPNGQTRSADVTILNATGFSTVTLSAAGLYALRDSTLGGSRIQLAARTELRIDATATVGDIGPAIGVANPVQADDLRSQTIVNAGTIRGTVRLENGDDVFDGRAGGLAVVDGNAGNDLLLGGEANDRLDGGAGADLLRGAGGRDSLYGGDGADRIEGGAETDLLDGGAGNDVLDGQAGGDYMVGGLGDDLLFGGLAVDFVSGEAGNDELHGGADGDNIYGGAGVDGLFGEDGDDFLDGSDDGDFILGGDGNDRLVGGASTDADLLGGEAGDDTLDGGAGNDNLYGGSGSDVVLGGRGDDFVDGQEDGDFLLGGEGNDTVRGGGGVDLVGGEDGNDLLFGGMGNDNVYGGTGIDALFGEEGSDLLSGGDGDDILGGNGGSDLLDGGAGVDTFLFFSLADSSTAGGGADVIAGFVTGSDRIDLSGIDANTTLAGDQTFSFLGVSNDPGAAGTLRIGFIQNVGIFLFGNTDNDPAADLIINIGTFNAAAGDFVL